MYRLGVKVICEQVVVLVQLMALAHQVHDNRVSLAVVAVNREVLPGIQLDVEDVAAHSVAQLKLLDAETGVALVRHAVEEGEEPVRHHLGEEGNVRRGVLLRPVVGRILLSC